MSAALPPPHFASAEMMSVLLSLYPGCRLIDADFPRLQLSWRHGFGLALDLGAQGGSEVGFYSGFRQRGGHVAVLAASTLLAHLRASADAATTVFATPPHALAPLLAVLAPAALGNDVVVVQDFDRAPGAQRDLTAAGFPAGLRLTFRRPGGAQTYMMATRMGLDGGAFARVMDILREFAVDIGGGGDVHGLRSLQIDLPSEGYRPPAVALSPYLFVHDGVRRSEGDENYSWLWAGAERRLRILLGCPPPHFRKARVVVPNANPPSNLHNARVFLNGERAPAQVQTWGEGVGALDVDLPALDGELVVTVAAPQAAGEGAQALSLCIDRIELSA